MEEKLQAPSPEYRHKHPPKDSLQQSLLFNPVLQLHPSPLMRTSEMRLKNKLEHLPPYSFPLEFRNSYTPWWSTARGTASYSVFREKPSREGACVCTQRKGFPAKGRKHIRDKNIHELRGNTQSSHHGRTPPWGFSLQALIIDKSCPHLNYTVHSSLWGKKILQKWKALSQERGLFCHLRTLTWKSRADGQSCDLSD